MTGKLPEDGPGREILLRGLRSYSDNCEAPYLTPGCPFGVDIADGTRGCAEECIELISSLGAPPHVDEEVPVGQGMRLRRRRRPRPRRGPDPSMRAFDAAEIYLNDEATRELEAWSPVSLLYHLRNLLGTPPPIDPESAEHRKADIHRIIEILDERGIPFDSILRGAFSAGIGVMIGVVAGLRGLGPITPHQDLPDHIDSISVRWADVLGVVGDSSRDDWARSIVTCIERAVSWVLTAPLNELIDWWPADGVVPDALPNTLSKLPSIDRWIADRFLATYLEHWAPESLLAEWEWIHGNRDCPIPAAAMRTRRIDPNRVAAQIADNALSNRSTQLSSVAKAQYQSLAMELLEQGRPDAAAGVFEAVLALEPLDADAHNNLGFCLMPDAPADALRSLEKAAELGYEPPVVNSANRVVMLSRLGRLAAAHDLADQAYRAAIGSTPPTAYLWNLESLDSTPNVDFVKDVTEYLVGIGVAIARRVKDDQLEVLWQSRSETT